ncbi:MAG: tetratricopeptide repeat protein [bacterium]
MWKIRLFSLIIILTMHMVPVFFISSLPAQDLSSLTERDKILAFADHLYETRDYYRAITEYTRFIFLFPSDPFVKIARLKIAFAYQKGEQWSEARQNFESIGRDYADQEIGREASFQQAETLWLQKDYQQAIQQYRDFIDTFPQDERINNAFFRTGCIHLELQQWPEALNSFEHVKPSSRTYVEATSMTKGIKEITSLPLKKPALAGVLSAVIPGAGQVYAHRYRDGLSAFSVNGGFIWGIVESFQKGQNALGGILLFIESGWYAGNIYSAISSTRRFNKQKIDTRLGPLLERCHLSIGSPGGSSLQEGGVNGLTLNFVYH